MRMADFILANIEPILVEWEAFARHIWPGAATDPLTLRDHAENILRAMATGMKSAQTAAQQSEKSKGEAKADHDHTGVTQASDVHAIGRVRSGFDLQAIVAEYRALRASVIRLWRENAGEPDQFDLDDLTRFNESIDQSLTEAARSYSAMVDRSRQMFLAILGHDLRNPLNAVMMSAEMLSHTSEKNSESSGVAAQISASAKAMARMISDLLDFTAAGLGGEMPLKPAPMDLKIVCQQVVDELRAGYPKRELRFEPQGDLTGEWDANRLRQLVSNVLGNAIQHGVETGPVDFSVTPEGSDVLLAIRNGGPPIPAEALPTIFEPLVRGTSPELQKQRRPGSIGLGLYIAREVATAHGGTIGVTSTAKDGTVFTVCLPRHHQARDRNENG